MDNNEGLFGLVNYKDTPLEYNHNDKFGIAMLKGSGRAFVDVSILLGAFCFVATGIDFIKLVKK